MEERLEWVDVAYHLKKLHHAMGRKNVAEIAARRAIVHEVLRQNPGFAECLTDTLLTVLEVAHEG